MEAVQPLHSLATRVVDEVELFADSRPLTDEELAQYARRTTSIFFQSLVGP